jgi:hypothetical protein
MMKEKIFYLWTTGKGLYVLLGLLVFGIFVTPLSITHGLISDIFVECVFALILITGIFSTPCSMALRLGMLLIAFLAVITRILDKFSHSNFIFASADNIFAVITLVAFSILIIKHFLLDKVLLRYRIAAAVAVYLIFGVLWARIYEIIYLFNPAAFTLNEKINPYSLLYFSFVTLTTIGYGDIVPVSIVARSLAILEGVVGQLYTVILISSLVSEFSAIALKSSNEQN